MSSPGESALDFGTIGMNEKRDLYFALINKGPVKVVLRGWGGNVTGNNLVIRKSECQGSILRLIMFLVL